MYLCAIIDVYNYFTNNRIVTKEKIWKYILLILKDRRGLPNPLISEIPASIPSLMNFVNELSSNHNLLWP